MCFLVTFTPYPTNAQKKHVGRSSVLAAITKVLRQDILPAALLLNARLPVQSTRSARPSTLEKAIVRTNATTTLAVMDLDMDPTAISVSYTHLTLPTICSV